MNDINNVNFKENRNVKLQFMILQIAEEIKKICDKNNIPYSISGGSLLGAVRHKGFIPWDDDFDLCMRRRDYEHFLDVCKNELDSNKFFLQTEVTEKMYAFAFAKVQLVGTKIPEDFSKNVPIHHGIFVDIFPIDNIPDNTKQRKKFLFINHLLKNMIWIKCGYGTALHKKKLRYWIFRIITIPFSIEWLKKKRYDLITKYNRTITKEGFCSDYPKHLFLNNWFNKIKKYKFEDTEFSAIVEADAYLKKCYGNYMQLPAVEDRKQHSCYEVDYGSYKD